MFPALFKYYGLNEIWDEAYKEVDGVTWLSTSAWDPCHLFTVNKKVTKLSDMKRFTCVWSFQLQVNS